MKTGTRKSKQAQWVNPVEPTHEEIAARAYELFVARGQQHGHDQEDWSRAEAEIRRNRGQRSAPVRQWSAHNANR